MEQRKKYFLTLLLASLACGISGAHAQSAGVGQTPLDRSLAPGAGDEQVSNVFRDMAVVQRKAMVKGGKFLLSNYGSLDFSDGPYSMYGFNINPGYALSDFWEIYVNYVPFFLVNKRSIVDKVQALQFPGGAQAQIRFQKPQMQYGAELLWAPAYGKDSVGSRRVIRSDTFFKLGVSQVRYEGSLTGMRYHLGVGKSYFLTRFLGFRISATGAMIETWSGLPDLKKASSFFAVVEAGLVLYL